MERSDMTEAGRGGEAVDHPAHYGGAHDPYEHVKVANAKGWDYLIGSATKYLWRCGLKEPGSLEKEIEDLEKSVWYIRERIRVLRERWVDKEVERGTRWLLGADDLAAPRPPPALYVQILRWQTAEALAELDPELLRAGPATAIDRRGYFDGPVRYDSTGRFPWLVTDSLERGLLNPARILEVSSHLAESVGELVRNDPRFRGRPDLCLWARLDPVDPA